jgi:hypothetical protein
VRVPVHVLRLLVGRASTHVAQHRTERAVIEDFAPRDVAIYLVIV